MIDAQNKLHLFFDTNFLETYFGNKSYLSELKISNDYYDLITFIKEHNLFEKVELCIPEMVWREIRRHMISCYKNERNGLYDKISEFRKVFGDLLDINYSLRIDQSEDYKEYVNGIFDDFLKESRCTIIDYPRDTNTLDSIVHKALIKEKPFVAAKNQKKEFSDAGFKDALIAETVIQYCKVNDKQGMFITNDRDFKDVFSNIEGIDIKEFFDVNSCKLYLAQLFSLDDLSRVRKKILEDAYLRDKILEEAGQKYDDSITKYEVGEITKRNEDDSSYNICINCVINEVEYLFIVDYDLSANEILNTDYTIYNE